MSESLAINWFDFLVILVLVIGVSRGRKRGLSEELLDVTQWLGIVVLSALLYQPLGDFLSAYTGLSLLLAYVASYLFLGVLIALLFSWIKRAVGEKLVQSDFFGGLEYYLGMLAGATRFACILLASLAILNAKHISPEEYAAQTKMQQDNFGSIRFPTLGSLQQNVFAESSSGKWIKEYLNEQLIVSTPYTGMDPARGPARKRERLVNEAGQPLPRH
jgi:uncharacterized membrane protein required for colicin V production